VGRGKKGENGFVEVGLRLEKKKPMNPKIKIMYFDNICVSL
jgi:hypothetical protein